MVHLELLKEALDRLKAQPFDVVLLDLSLPDSQGFETFVRLHDAVAETPIVVLSARADGQLAVQAVQAGAQDYLVKGRLGEDVLPRSIRYAIERQRADRTLAESEERYRLLIQRSPSAHMVHCDGKIVFANPACVKLFGADRQEQLLGRSFLKIVAPEFHDIICKRVAHVRNNGINPQMEVGCVRLDGTGVTAEASSNPFMHEGRPAVHVVLQDITERKRAEESVRAQAAMLDQAHDAIIVIDIQTRRITFWNQGAERLYGWAGAEAEGHDVGELVFIDSEAPKAVTKQLLKTGESHGEHRQVTKAGKKLTISSHATLVRDAAGEPKSALVINIDITAQKSLEAQFLRAQRMESIGTLASGLSHDLNNILAPIMMSVSVLRQELTPELHEDIVSTIEMSAERGAQIVKQVLTFGSGLEGVKHPLQLSFLINELMKIMRQTFPKGLVIESSLEPGLWPVLGDSTHLHQVLLNLCVNARDAMPDGGKLLLQAANLELDASYASMLPEARPGSYILLQVSDTGGGIPPEIAERIFDPFFTTKAIGKGTGLGLSTVLGIVKSHGGLLNVNSTPGAGTTFQIYLPAAEDREAAASDPALAEPPLGDGELVLIVDDEPAIADIARRVLESHGYKALVAADGTEALALFAGDADRIAIVLTDLMMPLLDGVALIRALRKMKPRLPVIASTGLGEKAHLAELKAMGIEVILYKPYRAAALLRTVHDVLHPGNGSKSLSGIK